MNIKHNLLLLFFSFSFAILLLINPIIAASDTVEVAITPVEVKTAEANTTEASTTEALVIDTKIDTPVIFDSIKYIKLFTIDDCSASAEEVKNSINKLEEQIATNEYTIEAREAMLAEMTRLESVYLSYQQDIECYKTWESEYYYAAKTWQFFKQLGYSDAVVCGIIGNMMIETSGGTLALKPTIYNSTGNYYGLCQWYIDYGMHGSTFEQQLEYLANSIEAEFKTFGKLYHTNFTYADFLNLDDPAEVALAFAKVYERCGSSSYDLRMQAAINAYEYFNVGEVNGV